MRCLQAKPLVEAVCSRMKQLHQQQCNGGEMAKQHRGKQVYLVVARPKGSRRASARPAISPDLETSVGTTFVNLELNLKHRGANSGYRKIFASALCIV